MYDSCLGIYGICVFVVVLLIKIGVFGEIGNFEGYF